MKGRFLLPEKREERKDSSKRQTQIKISPDHWSLVPCGFRGGVLSFLSENWLWFEPQS